MTREQKLALIVGFSLILAVGVLISDHLSRAQTDTIIADSEIDQPMVVHRLVDVPPGIGEAGAPIAGRDAVLPDPGPTEAVAPQDPLPGLDRDLISDPIDVASIATGTPGLNSGERSMLDDAPAELPVEVRLTSSVTPLELPGFVPVEGYGRPVIPVSPTDGSASLVQTSLAKGTSTQSQPTTRQLTHVVAEGETLYGIAAKYYGDGDRWPELLKANASGADSEGRVFEGARLVIPQRGGTVMAQAPVEAIAAKPEQAKPAQSSSGAYGSYTIKPGDTLSEISQQLMGTVRRMNELIELNKDQIQDADDIRVGMKLRYPRGQRA